MREDLLPVHFDGKVSKVLEECGEVVHCIGKYQRHGAIATDPKTKLEYDNIADMQSELKDLKISIERLLEEALFKVHEGQSK